MQSSYCQNLLLRDKFFIVDMISLEVFILTVILCGNGAVEGHFTCTGTCYKGKFIEENHVINNKALIGHSFKNFTAHASHQCLSACVSSCRCLAFQIQETRYELLDQNRLLTPHDFQQVQSYKYFDVQQELHRNVSRRVNFGRRAFTRGLQIR